ncbi:MAG: exodeoxyribonuclease VII small subunit [Blastopirellula sp.]|nr:MAG: exodeoxyribonuclease VII small subunit [Blastopirellula sp.]
MAKKKSTKSKDEPRFEEQLAQLEETVQSLEDGQTGLEDALAHYEQGIKTLKQCYGLLENTERKIELLSGVDSQGNPVTQPFEEDSMSLEEKAGSRSKRRSSKTTANPPVSGNSDVDDTPTLF